MTGPFEADPGPFLRPYAMTEGRTEPTRLELAIEDLVAQPSGAGWCFMYPRLAPTSGA